MLQNRIVQFVTSECESGARPGPGPGTGGGIVTWSHESDSESLRLASCLGEGFRAGRAARRPQAAGRPPAARCSSRQSGKVKSAAAAAGGRAPAGGASVLSFESAAALRLSQCRPTFKLLASVQARVMSRIFRFHFILPAGQGWVRVLKPAGDP